MPRSRTWFLRVRCLSGMSFGGTSLVQNADNSFSVKIKNAGNASWKGAFYLKCGSYDLIKWSKEISAGTTITLMGSYKFISSGSKTIELYYQTGGIGDGFLVNKGVYSNPMTISVTSTQSSLNVPDHTTFSVSDVNSTSFKAHWGKVDGATQYYLDIREVGNQYSSSREHCSSGLSYEFKDLKPGTFYQFRVKAINNKQESDWSKNIQKSVKTTPAPVSLTLVSSASFNNSNLLVGKKYTFSTNVKNTGSSSWTGRFYLKCDGVNLIPWETPRTIPAGSTSLVSGTYTPKSGGTMSLELYYKTETESSGALVKKGNYSNPFTVKVSENNNETETAQLYIYNNHGFNVTPLTINNSCSYSVGVENKGNSDWTGTLWLKEGDKEIDHWTTTISKGGARFFYSNNYTPTAVGSKTITLFYQTNSTGRGKEVNKGGLQNPLVVSVKANSTAATNLQLKESIRCNSSSVQSGNTVNLSTKVQNLDSENWSGFLYFTVDGIPISNDKVTIARNGGYCNLTHSWTPTIIGKHTINVSYRGEENNDSYNVKAGSFVNPITIEVTKEDNAVVSNVAHLEHLTRSVVPNEVTPGSIVNCFYKITNKEGKPLHGISAVFQCTGSSLQQEIVTNPSDENGIAQLSLNTEGSSAIAKIGETVQLTCVKFRNEVNGQNLNLYGPSSSDCQFTLKVHDGTIFQNIEKMKVGANIGASINGGLGDYIKWKVGGSAPIGLSWKYDDHGKINEWALSAGLQVEANADLGWLSDNVKKDKDKWFKCLNGNLGVKLGAKRTWSFSNIKEASKQFVVNCVDLYTNGTDKQENLCVQTIEKWASRRRDTKTNWDLYVNGTVGANINLIDLSKLPVVKGVFKKSSSLPYFGNLKGMTFDGQYDVNWDIKKVKTDYNNKKYYGESISVDLTGQIEGTASFGVRKFMRNHKSWFKGVDIEKYWDEKLKNFLTFEKGTLSRKASIKTEEEEFYSNEQKTSLSEISHTISQTSGWEFNLDSWRIKWFNFKPIDAGASYTTTSDLKLSSKGNWASYLQSIASKESLVSCIYPGVSCKSLISPVQQLFGIYEQDFGLALSEISAKVSDPSKYPLDETLVLEQTNSSELKARVSIPIAKWLNLHLNLGVSFESECYPTKSYYSVQERRFFPVIIRPSTSLSDIVDYFTSDLGKGIEDGFYEHKDELTKDWAELSSKVGAGSVAQMPAEIVISNEGKERPLLSHGIPSRIRRRHPLLAATRQKDISTFRFTIDAKDCFDGKTELSSNFFYPAGDLFAITDEQDTLFVVSDVFNLNAELDGEELQIAPYSSFLLDTHSGADDLTPFGLPATLPLGIYHSDADSNIWHYIGPADTPVMVDQLGSYILATSVKNDTKQPELLMSFNEESSSLFITASDNIGIRVESLQVMINGNYYEAEVVGDGLYAISLTNEDLQYRLDVYASIYDIAGNKFETYQLFQVDKPAATGVDLQLDTDISQLDNVVYIEPVSAKPGEELTLSVKMKNSVQAEGFGFDLYLPTGVTFAIDADGFPEAYLSTARTTERKTNTFESAIRPDGSLRIFAASTNGSVISGNDGEICTVKVNIGKNVEEGEYPLILKNVAISDVKSVSHDVAYVKSTLEVSDFLIGDANCDGKVTVADYTAIAHHILGNTPKTFSMKGADANQDGKVNVADYTAVAHIILYGSINRPKSAPRFYKTYYHMGPQLAE